MGWNSRLRIRVKVKHLVTGLAAASLLIGFGYKAMPVIADLAGIDASVLDADARKWKQIQDDVLGDGSDSLAHAFQVYVGPDNTFGIGDVNAKPPMPWEAKLPLLASYVEEGPATGDYLLQAAKQLAVYYAMTGESEKAMQALETAERRTAGSWTYQRTELRLERAALLVQTGEYDQAEALLTSIGQADTHVVDANRDQRITELRAKLLMKQGSPRKALDIVNGELSAYRKQQQATAGQPQTDDHMDRVAQPEQLARLETLRGILEQRTAESASDNPSAVSGTVTRSDGMPMAQVGVFLRARDAVNHSLLETEPYQTMTDDQGRYSFADVLPGAYQLTLGFNYEQIDGWAWPVNNYEWIDVRQSKDIAYPVVLKPLMNLAAPVNNEAITGDAVDFKWQPVEGAAYYKLTGYIETKEENGSSTIGVIIHDRIQGHEIRVPLDNLYSLSSGFAYRTVDGEMKPDPVSLLAFANPGKRFYWSVAAYDSTGQALAQSNGYRLTPDTMGDLPFFTLKARKLTDADRLLLAGRIDEAKTAYRRAWDADPTDAYSLGKLIKLIEARNAGKASEADKQELLPYKQRMMALQPQLADCYWLMDFYIGSGDWAQAEHYYELAQQFAGQDSLDAIQSAYASALLAQGKISSALSLLADIVPRDNIHAEIGDYIAADLYVKGDLSHALSLAAAYPERMIGQETVTDWLTLVRDMKREQAEDASYTTTLRHVLEWQLVHRQAELGHWSEAAAYPAMVRFLEALGE
ncbi:hypothetical protein GXP70_13665 [Paenibacillus lycopersici]|uniref:Carboxypeptidase regulatory-like domain-containing protein n=1 Tax=Paenibacillus lycopersici TaxID=2704462 RepID=A0A6C0FZF1_9BACL|nr:carboxypeptidase regulatory-like domain-containing protein [Paenibacillus lycopersici]QHT60893.1 hypothetical protein GXP70_13665 [Paenibacillus lycopersici]